MLVLLATSGGAYRAAFWTSLLLDRLIAESRPGGRWPGLAGNIRLVTGAKQNRAAGELLLFGADGKHAQGLGAQQAQGRDALKQDNVIVNRHAKPVRPRITQKPF